MLWKHITYGLGTTTREKSNILPHFQVLYLVSLAFPVIFPFHMYLFQIENNQISMKKTL